MQKSNALSSQHVENGTTNLRETQSMLLERIASEMNRLNFYIAHAQVPLFLFSHKFYALATENSTSNYVISFWICFLNLLSYLDNNGNSLQSNYSLVHCLTAGRCA